MCVFNAFNAIVLRKNDVHFTKNTVLKVGINQRILKVLFHIVRTLKILSNRVKKCVAVPMLFSLKAMQWKN